MPPAPDSTDILSAHMRTFIEKVRATADKQDTGLRRGAVLRILKETESLEKFLNQPAHLENKEAALALLRQVEEAAAHPEIKALEKELGYAGDLGIDIHRYLMGKLDGMVWQNPLSVFRNQVDEYLIKGTPDKKRHIPALGHPMETAINLDMRIMRGGAAAVCLGTALYLSNSLYKNLMGRVNPDTGERDTNVNWMNVAITTAGIALGVQTAKWLVTNKHHWSGKTFTEMVEKLAETKQTTPLKGKSM